jgi:hypothetical protein
MAPNKAEQMRQRLALKLQKQRTEQAEIERAKAAERQQAVKHAEQQAVYEYLRSAMTMHSSGLRDYWKACCRFYDTYPNVMSFVDHRAVADYHLVAEYAFCDALTCSGVCAGGSWAVVEADSIPSPLHRVEIDANVLRLPAMVTLREHAARGSLPILSDMYALRFRTTSDISSVDQQEQQQKQNNDSVAPRGWGFVVLMYEWMLEDVDEPVHMADGFFTYVHEDTCIGGRFPMQRFATFANFLFMWGRSAAFAQQWRSRIDTFANQLSVDLASIDPCWIDDYAIDDADPSELDARACLRVMQADVALVRDTAQWQANEWRRNIPRTTDELFDVTQMNVRQLASNASTNKAATPATDEDALLRQVQTVMCK